MFAPCNEVVRAAIERDVKSMAQYADTAENKTVKHAKDRRQTQSEHQSSRTANIGQKLLQC